jgi:hypothetical protein
MSTVLCAEQEDRCALAGLEFGDDRVLLGAKVGGVVGLDEAYGARQVLAMPAWSVKDQQ